MKRVSQLSPRLAILFLLAGGLVPAVAAQEVDVVGAWRGTLDVKVAQLRLELQIVQEADGSLGGSMVSLDQGGVAVPFDEFTVDGKTVAFAIKNAAVEYKGELSGKGDTLKIEGTFRQGGVAFPLSFRRASEVSEPKLESAWTGNLIAGLQKFDFQFRVYRGEDGPFDVKLDSFTEKVIVPGKLSREGNQWTIEIPATNARFEGELDKDAAEIKGKWFQNGLEFPLDLKRVSNEAVRELTQNRPQTPEPPYDYRTEDFEVAVAELDDSYDAGVTLAGTITAPAGTGRHPALIMVSGSGPQDRDETIFGHRPFRVIADHLAKQGYAVVRYDDRGVAQSKGDYGTATSADLAEDAEAMVRWARQHPWVDPDRVLICGHSEGGLIAPIVAGRDDRLAGIVLLAGPGVTGDRIIRNQTRKIAAAAGLPSKLLDLQDEMVGAVLDRKLAGEPVDSDFLKQLRSDLETSAGDLPMRELVLQALDRTATLFQSPWMDFFLRYDPAEDLRRTKCPVLLLIGEKDLQVDPELNVPAIDAALKAGGNPDYSLQVLPGLNHLFQPCTTGSPAEYNRIEETIAPGMLDALVAWLNAHFKSEP